MHVCMCATVVPLYLCKSILSTILGCSEGQLMDLCNTGVFVRRLFHYAVGMEEDDEVPQRSMPLSEFESWYTATYATNGSVLSKVPMDGDIEQSFSRGELGFYRFSGGTEHTFDAITVFPEGHSICLPKSVAEVKKSDIGISYVFAENWSRAGSLVSREDDGAWKLAPRFLKKENLKILDHKHESIEDAMPAASGVVQVLSGEAATDSQPAPPPSEDESEAPEAPSESE